MGFFDNIGNAFSSVASTTVDIVSAGANSVANGATAAFEGVKTGAEAVVRSSCTGVEIR